MEAFNRDPVKSANEPPNQCPLVKTLKSHAPAHNKVQLGAMGPFHGDARLNLAANPIAGY